MWHIILVEHLTNGSLWGWRRSSAFAALQRAEPLSGDSEHLLCVSLRAPSPTHHSWSNPRAPFNTLLNPLLTLVWWRDKINPMENILEAPLKPCPLPEFWIWQKCLNEKSLPAPAGPIQSKLNLNSLVFPVISFINTVCRSCPCGLFQWTRLWARHFWSAVPD